MRSLRYLISLSSTLCSFHEIVQHPIFRSMHLEPQSNQPHSASPTFPNPVIPISWILMFTSSSESRVFYSQKQKTFLWESSSREIGRGASAAEQNIVHIKCDVVGCNAETKWTSRTKVYRKRVDDAEGLDESWVSRWNGRRSIRRRKVIRRRRATWGGNGKWGRDVIWDREAVSWSVWWCF